MIPKVGDIYQETIHIGTKEYQEYWRVNKIYENGSGAIEKISSNFPNPTYKIGMMMNWANWASWDKTINWRLYKKTYICPRCNSEYDSEDDYLCPTCQLL